ncbi:MAG: YafY family protein [Myxococcota bacterium]|jgi:predicted DNA-binding transcriptional regulator YafY|nr:YafY family protein [Myxococcota bacterium]
MRRADRLFKLVQFLRTHRAATGRQIADELRVSVRTVYRDVGDLQASGIPIRGEAGVGYRLDRGFELPPLTFTSEELEGLALGARIVAAWGDADLAAAVNNAMTRIEAVLPAALRKVLIEAPLFAPQFQSRADMSREVATLRRAIGEHRALRVRYVRADGDESQRTIRPLGLHFWGNKWTLAAWCELRADYRSFRPDRMLEVEMLDRTFDTDGEISLAQFLERPDDDDPRYEAAC